MKYHLLCSGSKGNCFVLKTSRTKLVVDCGSTKRYLLEKFDEIKVSVCDVDALLLTHSHSDHISQLKLFQNTKTYAPFDLGDNERVIPEQVFNINEIEVTPLALSHDCGICVGYIFRTRKEKLVYITDTGYLKESYYPLISNADYYIMESNHDPEMLMNTDRPYLTKVRILSDEGHLNNEDCAYVLKNIVGEKTKEIVLAHISEEANEKELALATAKEALKDREINIRVSYQNRVVSGGK